MIQLIAPTRLKRSRLNCLGFTLFIHKLLTSASHCCIEAIVLVTGTAALAAPSYDIHDIGLLGAEHTSNTGYKYSQSLTLNESGEVLGYSNRYMGGSQSIDMGRSVWLYNGVATLGIGLTDSEHTRSDGYKYSFAGDISVEQIDRFNEAGQVVGYSKRYNGRSYETGRSTWIFNGSTSLNIGLVDTEHTDFDGFRYSDSIRLNESGKVVGFSERYRSGGGRTTWMFDGTTTLRIGLTDAEHTSSGGYKYSDVTDLNDAGAVIGNSRRYTGNVHRGTSAWLFDGLTTTKLGLIDTEHTRSDGFKHSYVSDLTQSGLVFGESERYNNTSTSLGTSVWLFDGSLTLNIGWTDAEHTRGDGYRYSTSRLSPNAAGQTVGWSRRYFGGTADLGQTAWLFNGHVTINIGLNDFDHTRLDGYRNSVAWHLNSAGHAAGESYRYLGGSNDGGRSVWLFDGTTTRNIGLADIEHTAANGYRFASVVALDNAGKVIGYSDRYHSGGGRSAWLFDGSTTQNIGLSGTENTRNDGYRYSIPFAQNSAGQVAGSSQRFIGSMQAGSDAWIYDSQYGTVPLRLSVRADGFASSAIGFLGEDGVVLGSYDLFEGMTLIGQRAFYWTRATGALDMGSLINGGLEANGWAALLSARIRNDNGQIVGSGLAAGLPADSRSALMLLPTTTEPILEGDFNEDGSVDAADYTVWRDGLGTQYTLPQYDVWRNNFRRTIDSLARGVRGGAVSAPEPCTIGILVPTFVLAVFVRRFAS